MPSSINTRNATNQAMTSPSASLSFDQASSSTSDAGGCSLTRTVATSALPSTSVSVPCVSDGVTAGRLESSFIEVILKNVDLSANIYLILCFSSGAI